MKWKILISQRRSWVFRCGFYMCFNTKKTFVNNDVVIIVFENQDFIRKYFYDFSLN